MKLFNQQTFFSFCRYIICEYFLQITLLVTTLILVAFLAGISITLIIPFLGQIAGDGIVKGGDGIISKLISGLFSAVGLNICITNIMIVFLFLMLVQTLIAQFSQQYTSKIHVAFSKKLSERLFNGYLNASLHYFYKSNSGKLVNNITTECGRASNTLTLFSYMLRELCMAGIYLIIPVLISWKLSIAAIALSVAFALMTKRLHISAERFGQRLTTSNIKVQSEVSEKLSAIKDVKSGVAEAVVYDRFFKAVTTQLYYRYKSMVILAFVTNSQTFLGSVVMVFVILVSFFYLDLTFTKLVLFLVSFQRLIPHITGIQRWYNEIVVTLPSLWIILSTLEELKKYEEIDEPNQVDLNKVDDDIVLKNASFHYKTDGRDFGLHNINMKFENNRITSIVGKSGAGKSTIADIVLGFNKPDQGSVLIGRKSIEYFKIKSLRKQIGYVAQDSVLFNDSIINNICWSTPEISIEEVKTSAQLANIDDFISELPDGYDTIVGDRGVTLSGGQKQRIILARNILTKPSVLILDEATSNLDSESERLILDAIHKLAQKMTVIMITHRIASTKIADFIYLIENGEVIESGTWDSLNNGAGIEFKYLLEMV